MGLEPEKLDVYRLAIGYVAWVYEKADGLTGNPVDPDPDSDDLTHEEPSRLCLVGNVKLITIKIRIKIKIRIRIKIKIRRNGDFS